GPVHRHRAGGAIERDGVGRASAEIQVQELDPAWGGHEDVVVLVARCELLGHAYVVEELLLARHEVDLLRTARADDERGNAVAIRADDAVVDRDRARARLAAHEIPGCQRLAVQREQRPAVGLNGDGRRVHRRSRERAVVRTPDPYGAAG